MINGQKVRNEKNIETQKENHKKKEICIFVVIIFDWLDINEKKDYFLKKEYKTTYHN